MGLTGAFVIGPAGAPLPPGLTARRTEAGWTIAGAPIEADPRGRLRSMVASGGQPALVGWVYDSDFAFLAGAAPKEGSFELVFGEPYDPDTGETDSTFVAGIDPGDPRAWCEQAGTSFDASLLQQARTVDTPFAEDRLYLALGALGIPSTLLNDL